MANHFSILLFAASNFAIAEGKILCIHKELDIRFILLCYYFTIPLYPVSNKSIQVQVCISSIKVEITFTKFVINL